MRTPEERARLEATRGVELGQKWKKALAEGRCPRCGRPTTAIRQRGEDTLSWEGIGEIISETCGCHLYCGHLDGRRIIR